MHLNGRKLAGACLKKVNRFPFSKVKAMNAATLSSPTRENHLLAGSTVMLNQTPL